MRLVSNYDKSSLKDCIWVVSCSGVLDKVIWRHCLKLSVCDDVTRLKDFIYNTQEIMRLDLKLRLHIEQAWSCFHFRNILNWLIFFIESNVELTYEAQILKDFSNKHSKKRWSLELLWFKHDQWNRSTHKYLEVRTNFIIQFEDLNLWDMLKKNWCRTSWSFLQT